MSKTFASRCLSDQSDPDVSFFKMDGNNETLAVPHGLLDLPKSVIFSLLVDWITIPEFARLVQ